MTQAEGYSPLPRAVQDRISKAWEEYRESIGFEGDEYFNLIHAGVAHSEAIRILSQGQGDREEKIKIWETIWLR